jgi:hypothetical protein
MKYVINFLIPVIGMPICGILMISIIEHKNPLYVLKMILSKSK